MKKYLLILFLFVAVQCAAQVTPRFTKIDQNTIVKDQIGKKVAYEDWKKMMATGDYSLRPTGVGAEEFLLYKLSPEEKERNEARRKAQSNTLSQPTSSSSFPIGQKFKGEKLTTITGEKIDLSLLGEKVYVINFWFISCPPCKKEMPELNQIVEKYKGKDVVFVGIALDDKASLKKFLQTTPFNYQIVANGNAYASKYDVSGFPTNVVIGKDGLVKFSTTGLASNTIQWLDKSIKEALN